MEFEKTIKAHNHLSPVAKALLESKIEERENSTEKLAKEIKPQNSKKIVKIKIEAGGKDYRDHFFIMRVDRNIDKKTILQEARKKATEIADFYNYNKETRKLSVDF